MTRLHLLFGTALPLLLAAQPALAQDGPAPLAPNAPPANATNADAAAVRPPEAAKSDTVVDQATATPSSIVGDDQQIAFSAGQLEYDYNADVVTATGEVRMQRAGDRLRADRVTWNRETGKVVATGNVAVSNPQGDTAYGDSIELTDTLKDGVVDNMLVVLDEGGRLAAVRGTRDANGTIELDRAVYSPCAVIDSDGCPKEPTWKINAVRVTYRPDRNRVYYEGARFSLFGLTSPALPRFSHPVGGGVATGLLTPGIRIDRLNGVEITTPVNIALGTSRSLIVTPHVFTGELPMLEASYRQLTGLGAFSLQGFGTVSRRSDDLRIDPSPDSERAFRGYLDGVAKFQLDPNWSVSGSLRLVTDRTFLRRYDISRDDRLRTTLAVERIDRDSYLSIAGWAVQTLRFGDSQAMQPVALPEIDYRRRIDDAIAGGTLNLQLNSLAISRKVGQDTQRAFASGRWDLRRITGGGQEVLLTAFARGDVYHASDLSLNPVAQYRGDPGFNTRAIGAIAAEVRWPFVGALFGGVQRLTPRLQLVASPKIANLSLPNEDARAVDLEDSNLFALNRFAGYDRWEDSSRVTYGVDWALDLPGVVISSNIGQSYRLNRRPTILPDGTGLSDRFSDIVGRTNVRVGDAVIFTHRYRVDKDSFELRRNEVDATVGSLATYAQVGYLRLNRDISDLEDLQDREEVRVAARVQFARFWSAFGSAVVDLTDRNEDVLSLADGFDPIRHRVGVTYEDDCLELGVAWKRDYRTQGDARRGNSFLLTLAFKNLGR